MCSLGPYSPTKKKSSHVLQNFVYLEAFEQTTTSDWLNHMV